MTAAVTAATSSSAPEKLRAERPGPKPKRSGTPLRFPGRVRRDAAELAVLPDAPLCGLIAAAIGWSCLARPRVNGEGAFAVPPEVAGAEAEQTHRRALAGLSRHAAERAGTEADIAEKRAEIPFDAAAAEREAAVLPSIQDRYDTPMGLHDEKFGPKAPVFDAEQRLGEHRAALKAAEGAAAQIRSLEAKRATGDGAFLADALDRRAKARQHASCLRLVAPVDGTVQGVKVHTPGAVVTAGDVLMSVVPDGTGIEIDASVENRDIGFVREGQAVEVRVDAFPFTRYGLIRSTLVHVGRDAAAPGPGHDAAAGPGAAGSGMSQGGLTYPAKVRLGQDWTQAEGAARADPARDAGRGGDQDGRAAGDRVPAVARDAGRA